MSNDAPDRDSRGDSRGEEAPVAALWTPRGAGRSRRFGCESTFGVGRRPHRCHSKPPTGGPWAFSRSAGWSSDGGEAILRNTSSCVPSTSKRSRFIATEETPLPRGFCTIWPKPDAEWSRGGKLWGSPRVRSKPSYSKRCLGPRRCGPPRFSWSSPTVYCCAALESLESDGDLKSLDRRINGLLRWADFGVHLTRPWKVVLAGRPNVGKSSLINALLGYTRSIVFDQPGTTRDVVTATTAVDGWPIELSDTAGLREDSEPLEAAGIERVRGALAEADLSIVLIDVSTSATDDDRKLLAAFPKAIIVAHKCDRTPFHGPDGWEGEVARSWLRVSSKTGDRSRCAIRAISARLVPAVPPAGTPVPVTARQVSLLRRAGEAAERGDLATCRQTLGEILR